MASARSVLAALGVLQLLAVACNFWSPLLAYMLPVALLASAILWISIYYNWKRGVELFIFLSAVLFIMALCPFLSVLIHRRAAERWHDVLWYSIEMVVESTCIATSIWVLYHTDYSPVSARPPLLRTLQSQAVSAQGMTLSGTPPHTRNQRGSRFCRRPAIPSPMCETLSRTVFQEISNEGRGCLSDIPSHRHDDDRSLARRIRGITRGSTARWNNLRARPWHWRATGHACALFTTLTE